MFLVLRRAPFGRTLRACPALLLLLNVLPQGAVDVGLIAAAIFGVLFESRHKVGVSLLRKCMSIQSNITNMDSYLINNNIFLSLRYVFSITGLKIGSVRAKVGFAWAGIGFGPLSKPMKTNV